MHDPEYYTQQILAMILGGGTSSRLFQEVREKRGLAYFVSAYTYSHSDCGIFGIYAGVGVSNANEYLNVIAEESLKLIDSITEDEIQRSKAQLKAGLLMNRESTTSRAEKLAHNFADFGRYITAKESLEEMDKVDKTSLSHFARKLFSQKSKN